MSSDSESSTSDINKTKDEIVSENEEDLSDKWIVSEKEKQLASLIFGDHNELIGNLEDDIKEDKKQKRKRKADTNKALWYDSDDEEEAPSNVNKKLSRNQLESKFERLVGKPKWADLDNKPESDSDDDILQKAGHIKSHSKSSTLQKKFIQTKRLKDLNRSSYKEGPTVTSIEFHPTSMVALVAGYSGIASLFSVNGYENDKLHTILLKNYKICCAKFNNGGEDIIFGGNIGFFYNFNLITSKTEKIKLPGDLTTMKKFEISSDKKYIAVAGRYGEVYLLNSTTKEWVANFKQEHEISSLTFSPDSKHIFSHSVDSEISVFDIRSSKMMHKFYDDGCISGRTVSISPNRQLLATGNQQGVVNIYNYDDVLKQNTPQPIKRILNLTTGIWCTKFNPTSEILGICSADIANASRLVHFPSATIFSNFPETNPKLGETTILNFSPGGKYLALGNRNKKVVLYSIKHYNNY